MKLVLSCFVLLLFAGVGAAQTEKEKPNFSGTWFREKLKGSDFEVSLKIIHQDPELRIVRSSRQGSSVTTRSFAYYTDARGEINSQLDYEMLGLHDVKTTTKWKGRKIESQASNMRTVLYNAVREDIIEQWELSSDGKKLTHRLSVTTNPYRPNAITTIETFSKIG